MTRAPKPPRVTDRRRMRVKAWPLLALPWLMIACATVPGASPASLERTLVRLRCEHSALAAWDLAELPRLADTCPTERDCELSLARHEAEYAGAVALLAVGYRAGREASGRGTLAMEAAAVAAERAARAALERLHVDLSLCP